MFSISTPGRGCLNERWVRWPKRMRLTVAARSLASSGRFGQFGRSLRYAVTALADLDAAGVAFVSVRDNLDLSTPSGRLMFQVVGAMAEFERALTQERVRAGLRFAQSRGKRVGRLRTAVDAKQVATLRAAGASWRVVSEQLGIGVGTACRALQAHAGNL